MLFVKINPDFRSFVKWGIVSFIAILISDYIINKLFVVNTFFIILITASIISILIQAVRSHDGQLDFRMRWFIFYFLTYSLIIFVVREYVSAIFLIHNINLIALSSLMISGVIVLVQKAGVRSRTVPWLSFILLLLLLVANLEQISEITPSNLYPPRYGSDLPESKKDCPSFIQNYPTRVLSSAFLDTLIKTNVWRIEHNFGSCYLGKYTGQHTERFYCDDLIVSRWDKSDSGAINYRWYTAVSTEWIIDSSGASPLYLLNSLSCENGNRVTVEKGITNYYVYVSKDGTQIRVEY